MGNQTNIPARLRNAVAISAGLHHNAALIGDSPPSLKTSVSNLGRNSNGFSLLLPSESGRVYGL